MKIISKTLVKSPNEFSASIFKNVLNNQQDIHELENNVNLIEMETKFNEAKQKLKSLGHTSRLWVQYIDMIDILKSNIRGDRVGTYFNHDFCFFFHF